MATTRQVISKTLILPAIGSFQYLAAVDPGLRAANGTALVPYVNTVDSDISFVINGNGTLDIYNVSGKNLSAGKRIVVSAIDHLLNLPVGAEQTVTNAPTTAPAYPVKILPAAVFSAPDSFTFSNTPVVVPFDASSVLPIIAQGYISDPGDNGGAFLIRKPGSYTFQGNFIFCATGGAAGNITVQPYIMDVASSSRRFRQAINFGAGQTDASLSFAFEFVVPQSQIDAGGGFTKRDFRIYSSAGTIPAKLGTAVTNTTSSCTMMVAYNGPDFFTAAP